MTLNEIKDNFNLFMSSVSKDRKTQVLVQQNKELTERVTSLERSTKALADMILQLREELCKSQRPEYPRASPDEILRLLQAAQQKHHVQYGVDYDKFHKDYWNGEIFKVSP